MRVCWCRRRLSASVAPAAVATDIASLVTESNARRMEALEVRLDRRLPLSRRKHAAPCQQEVSGSGDVGRRLLNRLLACCNSMARHD